MKSIVLVTDVPHDDDLITQIFTTFFDIVSGSSKASSGEQIPKAVHYHMTSILVILVDEAQSLPQDSIDIIVAQFLRVDPRIVSIGEGKSKKPAAEAAQPIFSMKELPPAYSMAKTICLSCPEKMAREISKYFNDVIMDASGNSLDRRESGDVEDLDASLNDDNLKELEKAHRLLRELWRACPLVLQNVIPQLEAELAADNIQLRVLATEALGDIASGIGAAGPPPLPILDPTTYPPIDLDLPEASVNENLLTKPSSPQSFSQVHSRAYHSFLSRKQDKSPLVRSSWAIAVGRILSTSAGGMGLSQDEELRLTEDMARMLNDSDERVRLAAVQAVGFFGIRDVINKLGPLGGVDKPGSVLGNLGERVKDRKSAVRAEAMNLCGRFWAVGTGEIAAGNESVIGLLGGIPSKILNTYYTNDPEIIALMDKVFFEVLLPLQYPPIKSKSGNQINGSSQRAKESQKQVNGDASSQDPDRIRTERILLLANRLDERAKKIFFALSQRQVSMARYLGAYLQACEDYNVRGMHFPPSNVYLTIQGGVMDSNETAIKDHLKKLINEMTKLLPDPTKVSADLWKFAKAHDRRAYQLIRFCFKPESDYKTVHNAIKEFVKRTAIDAAAKETLLPLLYRTSIILYNRSHVPAILEFSRTNEKDLSGVAHELLTDISARVPEVLKTQVREICAKLQDDAPSAAKTNSPDVVNDLKACASFAKKFPGEIPQDRKFHQAMASFAIWGSPPQAAKYAVSIIMAASNRKEMIAKDLVQKFVKGLRYGQPGFLAKMASLSQLWLLAPTEVEAEASSIVDFAVKDILLKNRSTSNEVPSEYDWSEQVDEECAAKMWAIRILVNRVRSHTDADTLDTVAEPIYGLLNNLIENQGELSKDNNTPSSYRTRLRLLAARSILKLCRSKKRDALFKPKGFHRLAEVAQDNIFEVREPFLARLKKYLSSNTLTARFYTIPFLLAYEPVTSFKRETLTWLKSRAALLTTYQSQTEPASKEPDSISAPKRATVLENVFPRLLSLLAHHPDYEDEAPELVDMARYIVFYLTAVANDRNISLIYHIAQRVKAFKDVVGPDSTGEETIDYTKRLHVLSDLATYTVRAFLEVHNWNLQSLPGKVSLPKSLFSEIKDHEISMSIASNNFLPDTVENGVDAIVRQSLRKGGPATSNKKRKSEAHTTPAPKKVKSNKLPVREREDDKPKKSSRRRTRDREEESDAESSRRARLTKGTKEILSSPTRKSGRKALSTARKSYKERDDSEDDAEMEEANAERDSETEGNGSEEDSEMDEEQVGDSEAPSGEGEVNNDEDSEMQDAADEDGGAVDKEQNEDLIGSSPPTSPPPSRSLRRKISGSKNSASTPVKATRGTPRASRSSNSTAKSAARPNAGQAQSSPLRPKSKKASNAAGPAAPVPPTQGRLTRSRA